MGSDVATLYTEHHDEIVRHLRVRSGCPRLAEDLASDVFSQAVATTRSKPDQLVSVGWLYVVAQRRLIDHWRSQKRHRDALAKSPTPPLCDEDVIELGGEVCEALAALTERQRAALCLRYLLDLPVGDVARELGCSYECATSLIARSRRRLTAEYEARRPQ